MMDEILIVDDRKDIRVLVSEILEDEGFSTRTAEHGEECFREVNRAAPDLIILDIWLQDSEMDGIRILNILKENNPEIPVIIISAHGTIEVAVRAMKLGACDYIEKPINPDHLITVVSRTLETARLRHENKALRMREVRNAEMVGHSQVFKSLRANLERAAATSARVLLCGPQGSGKELAARYLHAQSSRANHPFVPVNFAALNPESIETALFGQQDGSGRIIPGSLEQAHGGTVFLVEVAELPPLVQLTLLNALVHQKFQRVGGRDTVRVDFRVVSCTGRNLQADVEAGFFREDLFHRLNVVSIEIPPLRVRLEDIHVLVEHFIFRFHEQKGYAKREMTEEALLLLQTSEWVGNIRQLKNMIERILISSETDAPIERREIDDLMSNSGSDETIWLSAKFASLPLREAREEFEREYLVTQINRFGGNISRAAGFIGMERSALHRKLKSLQVETTLQSGSRVAQFKS